MYEIEEENPTMKNKKVEMMCDVCLDENMNPAIESLAKSFNMVLVGRPNSGKSSFIVNLMSRGRYNNERRGFKKMFHNIVVCSPSIASFKKNVFKNLDESKMFEDFNMEFIEFVKELTEIESEKGFSTLIICDDVGTQLRKNAAVEKAFTQLIFNRRHRLLSCITTVQSYKNLPVSVRTSASHLVLWRPTNTKELISIWEEVLGSIERKDLNAFVEWVFDKKHNFLFVDMSLNLSNKFIYFKNWERIKNI